MKRKRREAWSYGRDGTMTIYEPKAAGTEPKIKLPGVGAYIFAVDLLWASELEKPTSESSFEIPNMQDIQDPVELIEVCLQKAKQYLANKDPMQASEKLYKVAEEAIKYLAEQTDITEFKTAQKKGMWSTGLLNSAPPKLSEKLGRKEIAEGWTHASYLHVQGFHENRLGVAEVKYALPYIEKLVDYVREVSDAGRKDS